MDREAKRDRKGPLVDLLLSLWNPVSIHIGHFFHGNYLKKIERLFLSHFIGQLLASQLDILHMDLWSLVIQGQSIGRARLAKMVLKFCEILLSDRTLGLFFPIYEDKLYST